MSLFTVEEMKDAESLVILPSTVSIVHTSSNFTGLLVNYALAGVLRFYPSVSNCSWTSVPRIPSTLILFSEELHLLNSWQKYLCCNRSILGQEKENTHILYVHVCEYIYRLDKSDLKSTSHKKKFNSYPFLCLTYSAIDSF